MNGENQIGSRIVISSMPAQTSNNGADFQTSSIELPPSMLTNTLVIAKTARWVMTMTAKAINGIASAVVKNLEITVSASVIGRERQKRMLLFLRSAYSESRL